jgi:hypothetical protein
MNPVAGVPMDGPDHSIVNIWIDGDAGSWRRFFALEPELHRLSEVHHSNRPSRAVRPQPRDR